MEKNCKVLVITYDFYPDDSPNTYRWNNVLEIWSAKGVEVFVVSAQKSGFSEFEIKDGIKIYRTGSSWFEKVKSKLSKRKTIGIKETADKDITIDKVGLIRRVYDLTWKKLYFPDFAFLWQNPAFNLAEKIIKDEGIYNIITVSWPFSDHVVGSRLKEKYKIKWIADTIDPFYLSKAVNNNFLYHSLNYRYEKRILNSADVVTVLTHKLKDEYSRLYPSLSEKLVVNHNIFVPYDFNLPEVNPDLNVIKLVFVGTLSPITRSPEILLRLFSNLVNHGIVGFNIELHFYGNSNQCNDAFRGYSTLLNKSIFVHGMVPRDEIPCILNEASVVINIGNSNEYQEPSKILEYIYLKKRILNVCSIEEDSSRELLSDYPLNLNIYPKEINDSKKLEEIMKFITKDEFLQSEQVDVILKNYLLSVVQSRYFDLLSVSTKNYDA